MLWLFGLAAAIPASAADVSYKVTGIVAGDTATVSIGSDEYLATAQITADGTYTFVNVPTGTMFLKIEASGYNLPAAKIVTVNADGTVEPYIALTLAITKMADDPNLWTHSWQEDVSLSGYTTTAYVNQRPTVEFLGKKIVPADVPSMSIIKRDYHIILSDEGKKWTQEYAYRLLETLKTIPYSVSESGYAKFILTEDKLTDDIKIETFGDSSIVTISEDAFYYANPFLVNLDGVRGRFFSKRLHHALVEYATNFGQDEWQVNQILSQRFGCTMDVPDYKALTAGITDEDENHFQKFLPSERVAIINMFEELPDGFHVTPHLNYLVRRRNGLKHPLYPEAAAVSWCVDNGYIEFMESSFGGNNEQFDTQRLILHEKTHFLWAYTFSDEIKNDWATVGGWYKDPNAGEDAWSTTKTTEFVSAYAHAHNPNEDMAESVAYYVKNPEELRSRALEKYEFIRDRIMHGARYISKIPDHLTFEVLNLNPDYDYPGKIKRLDVKSEGAPDEDKKITVEIELNHMEGFEDGAGAAFVRITSPVFYDTDGKRKEQWYDMWMYPVDDNDHVLRGEVTISKYSKTGYWTVGSIDVHDNQGNQRFEGRNDCVWNLYINNALEDVESPKYIPGSLSYELIDTLVQGHNIQNLRVRYKVTDNVGISKGAFRLSMKDYNSFGDSWGSYDPETGMVTIDYLITEFYPTTDYYASSFSVYDYAGNETYVQFSDNENDQPIKYIHITTADPDTEAPEIDLNRISVYAEPTNPDAPDGETKVTINYYARDNKSGYDLGSYKLRDPQGIDHFEYHYIPGYYSLYFDGDPTAWKRYTINVVLPKGSAPGIWGLSELNLRDKAMNGRTYNFVETLIFEPDDNTDDYVLFADIADNTLTLKMTKTDSAGYSYAYRIINEDTGEELDGDMTAAAAVKANRAKRLESAADDADVAALVDVSSLGYGNCVAIVQVRDEGGNPVAVRNTRFLKSARLGDSNQDETIDVADVVNINNYLLLATPKKFDKVASDVNKDGHISVSDISAAIDLILDLTNQSVAEVAAAKGTLHTESASQPGLVYSQVSADAISVALSEGGKYSAMQCDIILPDKAGDAEVSLTNSLATTHTLVYNRQGNVLRVVVYSMSNDTFSDGGQLFTVTFPQAVSCDDMSVVNAVASDNDAVSHELSAALGNTATSIGTVSHKQFVYAVKGGVIVNGCRDASVMITTMGGALHKRVTAQSDSERISLPAGVYLVTVKGQTCKLIVE